MNYRRALLSIIVAPHLSSWETAWPFTEDLVADSFQSSLMRVIVPLGIVFGVGICFSLLAVFMPRLTSKLLRRTEGVFSPFARRKNLAILVTFIAVIGVRLALLPLLPVPLPLVHDEFSYLLQGDTLAHGRLANPPHAMWISFESFHTIWLPAYGSKYFPGQGLFLALGQWLGNPWIGVLLGVSAMCAAVLWMLQAWLPARWALLGAVLVALKFGIISYWINSYWGGAVAATGGALVLGAVPRLVRRARPSDAFLLGLGAAILANTRPYEGFLLCMPVACWFLWWLAGKTDSRVPARDRVVKGFLPVSTVLALTLTFMAYYNWRLTGNALLPPHTLHDQTYKSVGDFLWQHPKPLLHYHNKQFEAFYSGWEHQFYDSYNQSWLGVWKNTIEKAKIVRASYLWWGFLLLCPGLPFVLRDRRMRLPLITFLLVDAGFFVVIWGWPHYIAPITCVIFLLIVQAIRHVRTMRPCGRPVGLVLSWAAFFLLMGDIGFSALRHKCDPLQRHCDGLPGREAIVERLSHTPGKHLLMVRYGEHHYVHEEWVYNGAQIDNAKILWARELEPAQNAKLFAYFKDRKTWLVEPDENTPKLIPYPQAQVSPDP